MLHETRDKTGKLLTWSMSQDNEGRDDNEPSFWLGCWTVTRREMQSSGLGRVHFAKVLEALKAEYPSHIGRVTEIESTEGLTADSQPVRRAKFYKGLGLKEFDAPYELPLFQPVNSTVYVPQARLGKAIKAQLLFAPFTDKPVTAAQLRSIIRRIYERGYYVHPADPYIEERLSLVDESKQSLLREISIPATK